MAKRVIKIPKPRSLEDAHQILAGLVPDGVHLDVSGDLRSHRDHFGNHASTQYEASVHRGYDYTTRMEVKAHTPELLVQRFISDILPKLNARPVDPEEGRIGRHRRINGPTVPRLTHETTFPDGGLADE